MSKPANAVELVDRYLQAVRFWLPKGQSQEDLLSELGEDLRSQIEARESALGRRLELSEVSEILKHCGPPMLVASRLGPKGYLIGPGLFPIYRFVLKMVLLWILIPVFLFIIGPVNLANSGGHWGAAWAHTMGDLWSGAFIAAGVITLVFAILERTKVPGIADCKWDPLALPEVQKTERKPPLLHTVGELAFNWFGLIWLLLLPRYPELILGPAHNFLKFGTIWHTFYVSIVVIAVVAVLRCGITLARPQWAWFPSGAQFVQTALSMVFVHFMLNAALHPPAGQWNTFVALSDGVQHTAQNVKVAALINVCGLIGLAGAWLGLSIAVPINLWQLMQSYRKRKLGAQHSPSLQAQ